MTPQLENIKDLLFPSSSGESQALEGSRLEGTDSNDNVKLAECFLVAVGVRMGKVGVRDEE